MLSPTIDRGRGDDLGNPPTPPPPKEIIITLKPCSVVQLARQLFFQNVPGGGGGGGGGPEGCDLHNVCFHIHKITIPKKCPPSRIPMNKVGEKSCV